ncbi:MAG TPA: deoxyribodipyrimidine photolyase [Candidatus Aminicenantes bacterium]|nr:deoxyribodipyrimidine photolyase [Candidatus Aminicenantes bacterium]
MIQPERVQVLRDVPARKGRYVLYWMQQSQRAHWNHALEYAIRKANDANLPVLVGFGLDETFPEANLRHFTFMLEGLSETANDLRARGIGFILRRGNPGRTALDLSRDAALLVSDHGYLRHQRDWRETVAKQAPCRVVQVESDAVVPVETASGKAEIGARTQRPRIHKHLDDFLVPLSESVPKVAFKIKLDKGLDIRNTVGLLQSLKVDSLVGAVGEHFPGGRSQGLKRFRKFLSTELADYAENSRRPERDATSKMSPWLHFGQVSSLEMALQVREFPETIAEPFLEQLVVRRELAVNFTFFNPEYDTYACIPAWARQSLVTRSRDSEGNHYSMQQLQAAETSDPYWNAAMQEMLFTGFMHTYMRMYWGKKILEWTRDPEEAFHRIRELNNRFFLDGRDPNSFAGVAWIFGMHDRAWPPRPGFGKVRSMTASGLERKCDIAAYVSRVNELESKS